MDRRKFIKTGLAGIAALLLSPFEISELKYRLPHISEEDKKKVEAINYACEKIEEWAAERQKKDQMFFTHGDRELNLVYAPHADFIHSNRTHPDPSKEWDMFHYEAGKSYEKLHHSKAETMYDKNTGRVIDTLLNPENYFLVQRARAKKRKVLTDQEISFVERSLVTLANLKGRDSVCDVIPVIKHYPGGPPEGEWTEIIPHIMKISLEDLLDTYHESFEHCIKSGLVKAVMVNHTSYPDVESDLRKIFGNKFPEFCEREIRPASFSPLIIRGLLKEKLGYNGMIMADWFTGLNATEKFAAGIIGPDYDKYKMSSPTLKFISAIYAGIDFIDNFGANYHINIDDMFNDKRFSIEKFYKENKVFRKYLDGAFERFVNFTAENFPKNLSQKGKRILLRKAQLRTKIAVLLSNEMIYGKEKIFTPLYGTDSRMDRSGWIHEMFKGAYLSKLTGKNFLRAPGESNTEEYYQLRDQTNWSGLDGHYEYVLGSRYKTNLKKLP